MLKDFKAFLMRGNLLELAVAFILGVAFAGVVSSLVNVILSIVAAIFGASLSFDRLTFTLNGTPIPYGAFITAVVSFSILAFVLFLIVRAYQRLNPPPPPASRECPFCKTSIAVAASRCPNCTSDVSSRSPQPSKVS